MTEDTTSPEQFFVFRLRIEQHKSTSSRILKGVMHFIMRISLIGSIDLVSFFFDPLSLAFAHRAKPDRVSFARNLRQFSTRSLRDESFGSGCPFTICQAATGFGTTNYTKGDGGIVNARGGGGGDGEGNAHPSSVRALLLPGMPTCHPLFFIYFRLEVLLSLGAC